MLAAQKFYFSLLKFTLLATVLALGRAVFDPTIGKLTPFPFPQQVALRSAQWVKGEPAIAKSVMREEWFDLEGYRYEYQQNSRKFEIRNYYVQDSHGEIDLYAKMYVLNNKNSNTWVQRQDQNGSYVLFEAQQTVYLSACINSKGPSTVTHQEFFANRNRHDFHLSRLVPVLIGREKPRDNRCLWVTISTPVQGESVESVYQQVEAVWRDWYGGWSDQFPAL